MLLEVLALALAVVTVVHGAGATLTVPEVRQEDLRVHPFHLGGMLVDEKRRVMFCPIEKIASTQFKQLFFRLAGDENWFEPPYHKPDSPRLGHFDLQRAREMLASPNWTRAVVLRDPARRLLSSYMHLVLNPKTPDRYRAALAERHRNASWPDFVGAVLERDGYDNIHWTPQSRFCSLGRFHPLLTFVGNFEKLREHGELLIARAGLQHATAAGWGKVSCVKKPVGVGVTAQERRRRYKKRLRGCEAANATGDCMWCKNLALHKNNYSAGLVESRLSPALWGSLRHSSVYAPDHLLFAALGRRGAALGPFLSTLYDVAPTEEQVGLEGSNAY